MALNQFFGWTTLLLVLTFFYDAAAFHPVILVPGDGGSQMEAKLDKPSVVHYICDKKTDDYFNIWLNLEELAPLVIDCWVDNVRLVYNRTTRTTSNSPGVDIRVPGFGNSSVVEFLDPTKASSGLYFNQIVEGSLLPLGYKRDVDVRGASYDFRKAPNEMSGWLRDFKTLVEETYNNNGQKGVVFICHSMGAPLSLYFLHQQSQAWKDKYVRALVTLGGVWGGSVKALKAFASGDDLDSYLLPSLKLRGEQRTCPSTAWLLPSKYFWSDDEVLVTIDGHENKSYTRANLQKFFQDINVPDGYEMFKDTENLLGSLDSPGVDLYCLHGSGVSTVDSMRYKDLKGFPDKPIPVNGNGDGTVNIRSLRGCLRWQRPESRGHGKGGKFFGKKLPPAGLRNNAKWKSRNEALHGKNRPQVFHEEFAGVNHMQILSDPKVLAYVKNVMMNLNSAA